MAKPVAVIAGVGSGLSASLARLLAKEGYQLVLAARKVEKMENLASETNGMVKKCDVTNAEEVDALFSDLDGPLRIAIANPSARVRGPLSELEVDKVRHAVNVTAVGSFLIGQMASKIMMDQEPETHNGAKGTILFTGASAGVKGFPQSAPFAMGKFAQRGLSQSMSRELHPKGIHVAWINVDGGIRNPDRPDRQDGDNPDSMLDPDAIAETYLALVNQHRSAWSEEIAVRPWVERF